MGRMVSMSKPLGYNLITVHLPLLAQFTVHVRRQGVAALQNVSNPAHWLSIEGGLTKTSNGGHFCDFYVKDLGKSEEKVKQYHLFVCRWSECCI